MAATTPQGEMELQSTDARGPARSDATGNRDTDGCDDDDDRRRHWHGAGRPAGVDAAARGAAHADAEAGAAVADLPAPAARPAGLQGGRGRERARWARPPCRSCASRSRVTAMTLGIDPDDRASCAACSREAPARPVPRPTCSPSTTDYRVPAASPSRIARRANHRSARRSPEGDREEHAGESDPCPPTRSEPPSSACRPPPPRQP